jgi:uncharacterized protein (TIGR00369 family)
MVIASTPPAASITTASGQTRGAAAGPDDGGSMCEDYRACARALTDTVAMTTDETLAQWQADEAALRARWTHPPGLADEAAVAGRSGLELMEAFLAGELPMPPISQTLDFVLIAAGPGRAVFQGRPLLRHYNPLGFVHGGWHATLLDSAMGVAVHTALPAGRGYTTLELKVHLVRALTERVPLVRAEGRLIHCGQQVATADARLTGPDGKLYAHGSTTCLVFDKERTPP